MADVFTDQARQALIDAHAAIAAEVQKVVEHFAAADAAMGGILAALDLSDANLPPAASGNPRSFWTLPRRDLAARAKRRLRIDISANGTRPPNSPPGCRAAVLDARRNPEGGQGPSR